MKLIACFSMPQIGIAVERGRLTHLWGGPVALASPDGVLVAVSDETAPLGIRAGQTAVGARSLSSKLIVLPYDRPSYEEAAEAVWDLFAIESSIVEPVSPELCFVEMNGPDVPGRTERLAQALAAHVRITVGAGLARSKFVAHQAALADDRAPRTYVRIAVHPEEELCLLSSVPIERLPGLDAKLKQRLWQLGVRTLGDVRKLPPRDLHRQFKELGLLLRQLAQGRDADPFRALWPPRRIEEQIEFEEEVVAIAPIQEAIRRLAATLCGQLCSDYGRSVALEVQLANGESILETEKPASPINTPQALQRSAERLFARMRVERPVTQVTLRVAGIGAGSGVQLALLNENDHAIGLPHERSRSLDSTSAYLRGRFGAGAVVAGGKLRQSKRIGLWTYPLGSLCNEPVRVVTDRRGQPERFWHGGISRTVMRIADRWKEAEWFWGNLAETDIYRVETDGSGIWELHRHGGQWRLHGIAD